MKRKKPAPKTHITRTGVFCGNQQGFGFVALEGGMNEADIFIPKRFVNGAAHKDKVAIRIIRKGRRPEGEVVKILKRGYEKIIGIYKQEKNNGFVLPDEKRIGGEVFIPKGLSLGALSGQKVIAGLDGGVKYLRGYISEVLGYPNQQGVDISSILYEAGLPVDFSPEAMSQAKRLPDRVLEEEYEDRADYRDLLTVTIDNDDTKDVDDAITLEILEGTGYYRLGVHIADVSHYVPENSPLDKDAAQRASSVYLVDRVVPMLPPSISNGICSLNPETDRLALSCVMVLDREGELLSREILPSVIRVDGAVPYSKVQELLSNGRSGGNEEYFIYLPMLESMASLARLLEKKRIRRGAFNFNLPEIKIELDKKGRPRNINLRQHNEATRIIEEFMVLCNETVAKRFFFLELPFIYRTHDEPDPDKLELLADFARGFGYQMEKSPSRNETRALLAKTANTPEETIIQRMALRSMKQARYSSENTGHFGLALKYYCHFTAPIRRYPDLIIHRIIKAYIMGGLSKKRIEKLRGELPEICLGCSRLEREIEACERETENLKKVEYMADKVGQTFQCVISGVTSWGIFVELPNTIDGMVSISSLPGDVYIYNKESQCYTGSKNGKTYRLGDPAEVRLVKADTGGRKLGFVFLETGSG